MVRFCVLWCLCVNCVLHKGACVRGVLCDAVCVCLLVFVRCLFVCVIFVYTHVCVVLVVYCLMSCALCLSASAYVCALCVNV